MVAIEKYQQLGEQPMPPSRVQPEERSVDASKLSFPLQLVIAILSGCLAVAATNWATRGDVRSLAERQEQMARAIEEIRSTSPNRDVLDLKLQGIRENMAALDERLKIEEQWRAKTREQMVKRGVIDP